VEARRDGTDACFERLTEWDGDDVPSRVLVFDGDLPLRDDPLPRFLDDGAFTKLLQAARADSDPFVRLAVEFLARTGMRKGEFLNQGHAGTAQHPKKGMWAPKRP
jgi:integrase